MLRMMGGRAAPDLQTDPRVLTRAVWAPRTARRRRLRLLVAVGIPRGVVSVGLDAPSARRRGEPSPAQGRSRAPGRSSHTPGGKARGRRWLAWMGLGPRAWAARGWALPCVPAWGPSERCEAPRGRRQQPVTARAWPRRWLGVRWWPGRALVVVAASHCAALERLDKGAPLPRARGRTRLRLAAALSAPPPPRTPRPPGRPRLPGQRRPPRAVVGAAERTPWTRGLVAQGAGAGPREGAGAPATAVGAHTGTPPVARRWGLSRAPHARCTPQAVWATTRAERPAQSLPWCGRRWTMDVTGKQRGPSGGGRRRAQGLRVRWRAPPRRCGAAPRACPCTRLC